MRWLIFSFWVFVIGMLIWQGYSHEVNADRESAAHPQPKHYFFDPAMDEPAAVNPNLHSADVRQTAYWTSPDLTGSGFISHVVLKNQGNARAVGIQVWVRPYRGIKVALSATRGDGANVYPLSDNDPLAQFGRWINTPDLGPSESCTQTVDFVARPGVELGVNPHPQILFETEKPDSAAKPNP
jgi:hypothetical protein